MLSPDRISARILLAAALVTGCEHPAGDEAFYRRWEWETHRQHYALSMRTRQEQQAYRNWLAAQARKSP